MSMWRRWRRSRAGRRVEGWNERRRHPSGLRVNGRRPLPCGGAYL